MAVFIPGDVEHVHPMLPFPPLFAGGQETLAAEQNAHPKFIK